MFWPITLHSKKEDSEKPNNPQKRELIFSKFRSKIIQDQNVSCLHHTHDKRHQYKKTLVSTNEFPHICIQTFKIHGSEMTYSNHRIFCHLCCIVVLTTTFWQNLKCHRMSCTVEMPWDVAQILSERVYCISSSHFLQNIAQRPTKEHLEENSMAGEQVSGDGSRTWQN
jgi:hypothetical protein